MTVRSSLAETGVTSPSRILYLANSAKIGGGNRALMSLIERLDPSQFQAVLVAPDHGPLVEWAGDAGIPCEVVPGFDSTGRATLLRRTAAMSRILFSRGIRLVHANGPISYPAAALASRLAGIPRVCHLQFPADEAELRASFIAGPEAVVTCYEGLAASVQESMRSWRPRCRVLAVPNAIDTHRFSPAAADPTSRWRFGAKHVVLIVGHLSEVKGYPWFVPAAAQIDAQLPGCVFLALGGETTTPGYQKYLAGMAQELGIADRIHFLGWHDDVVDILRAADVVVMPSLAEGLPFAVLEAMACARPVVATPVNGVPEVVADGQTGLLVPPRDAESLATAVLRLLRDPGARSRMGSAARIRVETHFSIRGFVSQIQQLYTELIGAGRTTWTPFRRLDAPTGPPAAAASTYQERGA